MKTWHLLPATREIFSRYPEMRTLEPYHLQWIFFTLGYTDELVDEGEIAAAVEVAREDWPEWRAA